MPSDLVGYQKFTKADLGKLTLTINKSHTKELVNA